MHASIDRFNTLAKLVCAPRGSLSKRIRSIPAAQSEYAAITGQDPCMLAQLAYKDAQRAATIRPSWAKCFLLQVTSACMQPHAACAAAV